MFPELFTNTSFEYNFVCFFTHKTIVKKETLLNDVLNVLSHKPDMSFANNAIRIKPNFMLSAFNKWSFDSERPDNSLLKFGFSKKATKI